MYDGEPDQRDLQRYDSPDYEIINHIHFLCRIAGCVTSFAEFHTV